MNAATRLRRTQLVRATALGLAFVIPAGLRRCQDGEDVRARGSFVGRVTDVLDTTTIEVELTDEPESARSIVLAGIHEAERDGRAESALRELVQGQTVRVFDVGRGSGSYVFLERGALVQEHLLRMSAVGVDSGSAHPLRRWFKRLENEGRRAHNRD